MIEIIILFACIAASALTYKKFEKTFEEMK